MKIRSVDVNLATREIQVDGSCVPVGSRAFDILALLIAANGRVVSLEDILRKVWPDTIVDESNIRVHVCNLRKALGEDRQLIQNIPGRGYRLTQREYNAANLSINLFQQAGYAAGFSQDR